MLALDSLPTGDSAGTPAEGDRATAASAGS